MATPALRLIPANRRWPRQLDTIDAAPKELWIRGREEVLGTLPRIAIVGSRAPTPYGLGQARRFAAALAAFGATIVSGMARGVDQEAHAAALEVGGGTIAVLGSGVDRPWPGGEVAARVAREGLLLSEYPPGCGPRRHHFPLRNRLISGLSDAVLVVEAAHASGSLITARWAADQGRSVFAIPGRVDHPMARGCHRLISEGATLAESPEGMLQELGWIEAAPAATSEGEDALGDEILVALTGETLSTEELTERLEQPLDEVLVRLVAHELGSRVARAPGGLWRRC